jgi:hypothetical protein
VYQAVLARSTIGLSPNAFGDTPVRLTFTSDGGPVRLSCPLELGSTAPDLVHARFAVDGVPVGAEYPLTMPGGTYAVVPMEDVLTGLAPGPHTVTVQAESQITGTIGTGLVAGTTLTAIDFHAFPSGGSQPPPPGGQPLSPPQVDGVSGPTTGGPGKLFAFVPLATDPNGGALLYFWRVTHKGKTVARGSGGSFRFRAKGTGRYQLILTVVDAAGLSTTFPVTIQVRHQGGKQ